MKVLLAIARTDYGRPDAGDSYEYVAFHDPLVDLGADVSVFDTFGAEWRGDSEATGRSLLAAVSDEKPDIVICMTIEYELPPHVIQQVSRTTPIVNWFVDDTWRYRRYSRHIAPSFSHVFTTYRRAAKAYASGTFLPLGYNTRIFHPVDSGEMQHDVSFVGQPHGQRRRYIEAVQSSGLSVHARGNGWPAGRVETEELAPLLSQSKINLSFLEGSSGRLYGAGLNFKGVYRLDQIIRPWFPPRLQLKGRVFEIAGCGGFQLCGPVPPEVADCFEIGKEIVTKNSLEEFVKAIRYYLHNSEEREAIARAGLARAQRDHTFQERFKTIFATI